MSRHVYGAVIRSPLFIIRLISEGKTFLVAVISHVVEVALQLAGVITSHFVESNHCVLYTFAGIEYKKRQSIGS